MSQRDLAASSNVSLSYLSMIENNKREPGLATLQQIADGLQVPLTLLVFFAADADELKELDDSVREKLSAAVLALMQ